MQSLLLSEDYVIIIIYKVFTKYQAHKQGTAFNMEHETIVEDHISLIFLFLFFLLSKYIVLRVRETEGPAISNLKKIREKSILTHQNYKLPSNGSNCEQKICFFTNKSKIPSRERIQN